MLHFNQRGWFRMFPDDVDSGDHGASATPVSPIGNADDSGSTVTPGIPIDKTEKDDIFPVPSTAKEYYLAKIAGLVGEDGPIERQLSKAVIPIVKKASVEFAPVDPEEFPDAPEGALMATYTFSEEENAMLGYISGIPTILVDGIVSVPLLKSDPSFPIDGFEYTRDLFHGSLKLFTGMSSSGTKVIDFFYEREVEPQPKTREEYYLAMTAGVFIANMGWKRHDLRLSKGETELALDELDPDDGGLNRWPHGTASFTTARMMETDKIIVNGDQEAAYLVDDDGPIPESGYAFKKNLVRDKDVVRTDITIWHIDSTDVTETINFVCFNSSVLVEDIPEPKTRSEAYDYILAGLDPDFVCPEPLTNKEFYKWMIATRSEPPIETKVLFDGIGEVMVIDLPNALDDQTIVQRNAVSILCLFPKEEASSPWSVTLDGNVCHLVPKLYGVMEPYYCDIVDGGKGNNFAIVRILLPNSDQSGDHHAHVEVEVYAVPEPKTRTEIYYAKLAKQYIGELPEPKTPTEFYLAIQAGWVPTDARAIDEDPDLATHESENDGTK